MKRNYKEIDLFCGIGGFRLAMNYNHVKCAFSSTWQTLGQLIVVHIINYSVAILR